MADRPDATSASVLVAFARNLRRAGLAVPVENLVQYLRAVAAVGMERDPLYWAGRIVIVHRHEDIGTYNRVFDSFWGAILAFASLLTAGTRQERS